MNNPGQSRAPARRNEPSPRAGAENCQRTVAAPDHLGTLGGAGAGTAGAGGVGAATGAATGAGGVACGAGCGAEVVTCPPPQDVQPQAVPPQDVQPQAVPQQLVWQQDVSQPQDRRHLREPHEL